MAVATQFTGTLQPSQYYDWFTWGWPRNMFVNWSVRPQAGQVGNVVLRALTVEEAADGTLTYWLTVWNIGSEPIDFEAIYQYEWF